MIRPVYFIVVCWGAEYRHYLLNYLVASLLAPGNLPALMGKGHKFLFVTPGEEWEIIKQEPIVKALAQYAEPVHIPIPYPPEGASPCVHMGLGHKLATDLCFRDKAYGFVLTPDALVSDGTMRAAQKHALEGKSLIIMAALRFATEPLFEAFAESGYDRPGPVRAQSAEALSISGRELVRMGVPAFHSQTLSYDFDAPYFFSDGNCVPAVYWRVPSDGGVVLHSLSWAPILMDYAAVSNHDTRALEEWTIDGDYLHANFGKTAIHVCTDSDEMMLMSWGSENERPVLLRSSLGRMLSSRYRRWHNSAAVRYNLSLDIFDPMKLAMFSRAVRWHVKDIDENWLAVEKEAARLIAAPRPLFDLGVMSVLAPMFTRIWRNRLGVISQAILGNAEAVTLVRRRVGQLFRGSRIARRLLSG